MESVARDGVTYAILARKADLDLQATQFFTQNEATLQVGVIAHGPNYVEKPHYHRPNERKVTGTYETLQVTRGSVTIDFYDDKRVLFKTVELGEGDLILLMDGIHRIRTASGFAAVKVKQGPYISVESDKVSLDG